MVTARCDDDQTLVRCCARNYLLLSLEDKSGWRINRGNFLMLDWYYRRPELAKRYLEEFSNRGARALTVFAERGLGKTAFLQ